MFRNVLTAANGRIWAFLALRTHSRQDSRELFSAVIQRCKARDMGNDEIGATVPAIYFHSGVHSGEPLRSTANPVAPA